MLFGWSLSHENTTSTWKRGKLRLLIMTSTYYGNNILGEALLCAAVMGYRRHMLVPGSESGSRVIGGVNPTHSSHIFPPCRPEKTGRADRIPLSPRIRAVGFQGRCSPRKKGQKTSFSLPLHKHTAVSTACPLELWGLPT